MDTHASKRNPMPGPRPAPSIPVVRSGLKQAHLEMKIDIEASMLPGAFFLRCLYITTVSCTPYQHPPTRQPPKMPPDSNRAALIKGTSKGEGMSTVGASIISNIMVPSS